MVQEEGKTLSDVIRDYMQEYPDHKTKKVIDGLKERGVEVSVDLVNKVKYRLKKKAAGEKPVKKAKARAGRKGSAKPAQGELTGTQLILNYMKEHRGVKPKQIQAGLAAQGHKVTMSLISAVRARRKAKRKAKRVAARAVATAARSTLPASASAISAAQLVDVKRLADALGGADAVRTALNTLDELR
jgi:hypothetical protein